jgi:hypothetical protein
MPLAVSVTGDQKIAALVAANTLPNGIPMGALYASLAPIQCDQVDQAYEALLQYQNGLGQTPIGTVPPDPQVAAMDDQNNPAADS